MSDAILISSLQILSELLERHYERKVIILIDEYDVPLDKAMLAGYYDDMANLISTLFSQALKSNSSLHFAVLTGCLRVTKESIFMGLNNEIGKERIGIIIELKYAKDNNLKQECMKALAQIEKNNYEEVLQKNGMRTILKYGIACHMKQCKVLKAALRC